jgi:hypothetical protein
LLLNERSPLRAWRLRAAAFFERQLQELVDSAPESIAMAVRGRPQRCLACSAEISLDHNVTPVADTAAWASVRGEHEPDCSLVLSKQRRSARKFSLRNFKV